MSNYPLQLVKFPSKGADSFFDAIKQRVNEYFESNQLSRHANAQMRMKTIAMLSMYFLPYFFIVTGVVSSSLWIFYVLWAIMGFGIAGIGTSVMHDSNHGSYSENNTVNFLLGSVLNVLGGYSRNWKIQHNILHHTYTNLDGLDEDIDAGILLRMSPHAPYRKFHRFQHLYAWFLYAVMNIFWVTYKDYKGLNKYNKNGLLRKEKVSYKTALTELTAFKVFYIVYILVLPVLFSGVLWYHVVIGFLLMHVIGGLLLACTFQLAHVMESSEYPVPSDTRKMENNWAVHQLLNTTNFAPKNKLLSWYIGGLNYQIEHHLFPHICHVHYPKIAKIVEEEAAKFQLPYNVQPTLITALGEHKRMLKKLGRSSS